MARKPEPFRNSQDTTECPLEKGLSGLQQAAAALEANAVAVLIAEGLSIEVLYPQTNEIPCCADVRDALNASSGPVPASCELANFLRSSIAPHADSFLLFPWRAERRVVTILFGFASPRPAHAAIPDPLVESLNLAALAAWSFKEADRLRAELRVVNHQLAGRKLVERAKSLLQTERGMTEQQAYEFLRKLSRQRRVTIVKLAEEFICTPGTARMPCRE
jgi:hypothetical protein